MSIEAMKMALEWMEKVAVFTPDKYDPQGIAAAEALHAAIEQAEKQEPVACGKNCVPLSADGSAVFIDGVGLVPIQFEFKCKAKQSSDGMYCDCGNRWDVNDPSPPLCRPLYATPPQREWVGLTDEEQRKIWNAPENYERSMSFARAIEQALKEKNT